MISLRQAAALAGVATNTVALSQLRAIAGETGGLSLYKLYHLFFFWNEEAVSRMLTEYNRLGAQVASGLGYPLAEVERRPLQSTDTFRAWEKMFERGVMHLIEDPVVNEWYCDRYPVKVNRRCRVRVNAGGWVRINADDYKEYVHPTGNKADNPSVFYPTLYRGRISIPGATKSYDQNERGLVRLSRIVERDVWVGYDTGDRYIELGYEDDKYADNGYGEKYSHAYVVITVDLPPPPDEFPPLIEEDMPMPTTVTPGYVTSPPPPPMPDLLFTNTWTEPAFPKTGDPLTVCFTLVNQGQVGTDKFTVRFELDNGARRQDLEVGPYAGGATDTVFWTFGQGLPAGPHWIYAYLDVFNDVSESNETMQLGYCGFTVVER
jgi:hypothetical protein